QSSFNAWQNVSIAQMSVNQSTDIPTDITVSNASTYLTFINGSPKTVDPTQTVIVLDENHGILSFFGLSTAIIGLASAAGFNDTDLSITSGAAIISGTVLDISGVRNVTSDEAQ